MAYDEHLAARVRALLSDRADVSERKMFGGLTFLLGLRAARSPLLASTPS